MVIAKGFFPFPPLLSQGGLAGLNFHSDSRQYEREIGALVLISSASRQGRTLLMSASEDKSPLSASQIPFFTTEKSLFFTRLKGKAGEEASLSVSAIFCPFLCRKASHPACSSLRSCPIWPKLCIRRFLLLEGKSNYSLSLSLLRLLRWHPIQSCYHIHKQALCFHATSDKTARTDLSPCLSPPMGTRRWRSSPAGRRRLFTLR